MDMTDVNKQIVNSARKLSEVVFQDQEHMRREAEARRQKDMQEKENHDNLNFIAQSSQETVQTLKEMNEVLKENNELLREKADDLEAKLCDISETLRLLFEVDSQSCETQEEELQQLEAIEKQITDALKRGEKFNWKETVASFGFQTVSSAIFSVLQTKGFL